MALNGSGLFIVDSAGQPVSANTLIESSVFNALTADLATGLSTMIAKDGQTTVTANLPMATYRHTGVGNASARTDYAAAGQVQDGKLNWVDGGGTADAITATYSPAITALVDGQLCCVRATAANATTTPTFAPNGLTARTIVKKGGAALVAGDIVADGHELILRYDLANTRWELMNPVISINDSPQFAGINLGHASDTTLTRVSAGVMAVEGSNVLLASGLGSVTQAYDADIPTVSASQAEMEAGTEAALRSMSPLRVAQAVAALSVGKVVQMVKSVTGAVSTTTGTIPQDDTIPQNTEGGEFMTLAITPTSASNRLLIMHTGMYTSNTGFAASGVCVALFQDSTANALSATNVTGGSNSAPQSCSLTHEMAAGTTSATTFKIRAGCGTAATTTFNGAAGARLYGGVASSSLVIMEIEP